MRQLYYLVLVLFCYSCDDISDSCKEEKYSSALVYDFPDTLQVGQTHDLKIEYIIENSCGSFVEFEEIMDGNTTELKIKMLYEGCSCNLVFSEEENKYPILKQTAGNYSYKFWVADNDYDIYNLVVVD